MALLFRNKVIIYTQVQSLLDQLPCGKESSFSLRYGATTQWTWRQTGKTRLDWLKAWGCDHRDGPHFFVWGCQRISNRWISNRPFECWRRHSSNACMAHPFGRPHSSTYAFLVGWLSCWFGSRKSKLMNRGQMSETNTSVLCMDIFLPKTATCINGLNWQPNKRNSLRL